MARLQEEVTRVKNNMARFLLDSTVARHQMR